jgi:beta-lactamase class A
VKHSHSRLRVLGTLLLVGVTSFAIYHWVDAEGAGTVSWKELTAVAKYEAPKSTTAAIKAKQQLQTITSNMSNSYGTNVGVVVTDLSNGASASTNADTPFVSASVYKLFVAYDVYKKVDAGTVALTDKLTSYGTSRTVGQCLDDMLTVSDNTCGKALGKLANWGQLDALLGAEGYTHTVLNNYDVKGNIVKDKLTSASDVARLLTRLYDGSLLSKTSSAHFIELLKGDTIDYMLPSGLPSGTVVAHKVGFLGQYQHDAGIIYGTKKDMLVVMLTKGWTSSPEAKATAAFTTLGQAILDYAEK